LVEKRGLVDEKKGEKRKRPKKHEKKKQVAGGRITRRDLIILGTVKLEGFKEYRKGVVVGTDEEEKGLRGTIYELRKKKADAKRGSADQDSSIRVQKKRPQVPLKEQMERGLMLYKRVIEGGGGPGEKRADSLRGAANMTPGNAPSESGRIPKIKRGLTAETGEKPRREVQRSS